MEHKARLLNATSDAPSAGDVGTRYKTDMIVANIAQAKAMNSLTRVIFVFRDMVVVGLFWLIRVGWRGQAGRRF